MNPERLTAILLNPVPPSKERGGCSEEAGNKIARKAANQSGQIARFFCDQFPRAFSADEVAAHLKISVLSARPRVSELYKVGLIRKTAERRRNRSMLSAAAWVATALLVGDRAVAAAEGRPYQETFLDAPSLAPDAGLNGGAAA